MKVRWFVGLLVCWFVLWGETAVFAHGGGPIQIAREPMCDEFVSVWLNPDPTQSNDVLHLTVGVAEADSTPVLDKMVTVAIVENGTVVVSKPATTEQSVNRLFYEADFDPVGAGDYTVDVSVSCPTGDVTTSFAMPVKSATFLSRFFPFIIGGFLFLIGFLIYRRWQKGEAQVNRPARPRRST